ncbi:MAG TPA: hypothetical protein VFY30_05395 [Solirubrobacterales bacterium]|nr:hypothetical protein [Solirubrobacterales bacterium]
MALGALAWLVGLRLPGIALAHEIGERIVCAVRLSYGCRSDPQLAAAYGDLAREVRDDAPRIVYERGMTALPVDFRDCRSPRCSNGPESGRVARTNTGLPVTLFTHVIDCRDPVRGADGGVDCSGERAGRVYVQYWEYYDDSATSRALYGSGGYHRDDWEGYQVRIDADGAVSARATSHNGYNGSDAPGVDWASDASGKVPGATALRDAAEALGLRGERGWTPSQGTLYVSGGSHAGHATEGSLGRELAGLVATERLALSGERPRGPLGPAEERHRQELLANRLSSWLFGPGARETPRGSVKLIPIESLTGLDSYSFAISPPWRKRVYTDPEYDGTD